MSIQSMISRRTRLLMSAALATICAAPAWAGDVAGEVTDAGQVRSLAGADVEIVELRRAVASEPDGAFRFNNVPAGTYTLRVSYAGAEPFTQQIVMTASAHSKSRWR